MRSPASLGLAALLLLSAALAFLSGPVRSQDPDYQLSFDWSCHQLRCQFEVPNATEAVEGNVTEIAWSFGPNGTSKTGNPVSHTFPSPGTYDVTVVVTAEGDDNGTGNSTGNSTDGGPGQASVTQPVRVSQASTPWAAVVLGLGALAGSVVLSRLT